MKFTAKSLSPEEQDRVHKTSLQMLSQVGVKFLDEKARSFVQEVLIQQKFEAYFGETLIQHIQHIPDGVKTYKKGIQEFESKLGLKYLMNHRAVAEENFVYIHSQGDYRDRTTSIGNLFRFDEGKIVEVWQCSWEAVPEKITAHTNTMFRCKVLENLMDIMTNAIN